MIYMMFPRLFSSRWTPTNLNLLLENTILSIKIFFHDKSFVTNITRRNFFTNAVRISYDICKWLSSFHKPISKYILMYNFFCIDVYAHCYVNFEIRPVWKHCEIVTFRNKLLREIIGSDSHYYIQENGELLSNFYEMPQV